MTCPICKDTGQILLLTSYVACDCKIKESNILDLMVGEESGVFISMGAEMTVFNNIRGVVRVSKKLDSGEFETVIKNAVCGFRFIHDSGLPLGRNVIVWISKGLRPRQRIQWSDL